MPNLSSPVTRLGADRILGEQSFRELLHRSSVILSLALGVPLLVLLALIFFMMRSTALLNHTNEVILRTIEVKNLLITMQNGARGYLLGRDETYLTPYNEAMPKVLPQLDALVVLITDNPPQQTDVMRARGFASSWMKLVEDYLEAGRLSGVAPSPEVLRQGRDLMDQTQRQLDRFIAEEHRLREQRGGQLQKVVVVLFTAMGLAALLGVPILIAFLRKVLRKADGAYRESLAAVERRAGELHVTLSSIGDAVVATNRDGRVEFLNTVAEKMVGWTNAEAVGRPLTEIFVIVNEHTGKLIENPVERVLRENVVVGLANHTVLRARNGTEVPIEDSAAPIRTEKGDVLGVILVFHDVSEKKKAEKHLAQLHRRETFLHRFAEAKRDFSDVQMIMKEATRLLGQHMAVSRCAYAEVDPAGERFIIPQDYAQGCPSSVGDYELAPFGPRAVGEMHGGRTLVVRHVDAELERGEGREMFQAIAVQAIICCPLVKDGQLRAMMAVHQTEPRDWLPDEVELVEDVVERCWATIERARAEGESKERAERFQLLSEVVALHVWTADAQGQLDYVNEQCVQYFGAANASEMLGQGWTGFLHPEDLPRIAALWRHSVESGSPYETEFQLRGGTGDYRWFIVRAEPVRNTEGAAIRWFGSNTDIQELKLAQGRAEQANRAKDAFLAALSHELRTPLTPVLMTAASLRDDERLPADAREQLEMMERNITLEARLIDDLLDVTSIVQGKLQLRPEPCDAHALIRLAGEIVRNDAAAKNVELIWDFRADRFELDADPARFQQVIWNLLRNAVKFTPPGGRIIVKTTDLAEDRLRIEVADSGIGIKPELLEQIFAPFDQGGLTGDHRFGGMGLGLSIARAILQVLGGTIHAKSAGTGEGSTFFVEIPGARVPQESPGETSRPPVESTVVAKKSLRLLLVEDHDSTLLVLSKLLTRDGHTVTSANSAASAISAAAEGTFDLVISDLGLPDATGHELMEQLGEQYGLHGIALSGYGMEEDLARSRAAGFILHLTKPVDFGRLRQALAEI